MTAPSPTAAPAAIPAQRISSPGVILAIILAVQLMIGLDVTIVNVALPAVQDSLHFSTVGLSWVLNMYALAFGGFVLLGGRAGDILGRRQVFMSGIALFAAASLGGGLSTQTWELITARGLQGLGAAMAAPSALALLMMNFPDPARRTRALSFYSITTALGTSVGLILGGMLVSWTSWRWVLFVNLPVAVAVLVLTPRFIAAPPRRGGQFDLAGAVISTASMGALVYGFVHASTSGWSSTPTVAALAGGAAGLAVFFMVEARASQPVTPLWLFRSRNRAAGYAGIFLLMAAMYSLYFFGTLFMERVLGYGPLKTGVAFLATTLAAVVAARSTGKIVPHVGTKPLLIAGSACALAGSIWMTQLGPGSSYATSLLGPLMLFGLGMGLLFPSLNMTILAGVKPQEAGVASGLLQAMQFVGGTIGLSVLVTIFGTAARHAAASASPAALGAVTVTHGIATAYIASAVITGCTLLIALLAVKAPRPAGRPS